MLRRAFSLIELLTVITIISLVASLGLVTLKDTGEIHAKRYTTELLKSIKEGIASVEEGESITGFLNDFGTMPPHLSCLLNREGNLSYVNGTLGRYRITNLLRRDQGEKMPAMPFLDGEDSGAFVDSQIALSTYTTPALYIGYHGGYIGQGVEREEESSLLHDGWGVGVKGVVDLNISSHAPHDFLTLYSAGSDGRFEGGEPSYLKEEFDPYRDPKSLQGLYASDITTLYDEEAFTPTEMMIDVDTESNRTRIVIYSPMLYYAEDSSGVVCSEENSTHADCDGDMRRYIPYIPHVEAFDTAVADHNMSWHVGVAKYCFDLNTTDGNLSINNHPYHFAGSSSASLKGSSFFESIRIHGASLWTGAGDENNPFYMSAGEKVVVILRSLDGGQTWEYRDAYTAHFLPNKKIAIVYPR